MKRKVDDALRELICGILMSGFVVEIIDLIVTSVYVQFSGLRLLFATGLWIGVAVAVALAVHMHRSIDRALDMPPQEAEEYMRRAYLVRTVVILLAAAGVHYLRIGYVMAYFVGVLCLNSGAFLQRVLHLIQQKINSRKRGGNVSGKDL